MHPIQQKLLVLFDDNNRESMSLRAIALAIGEKEQPQKIKHHVDQLIKKGLLTIDNGVYRKVKPFGGISTNSDLLISVPIIGVANCGPADRVATENLEGYIKISKRLIPSNHNLFALRATGQSMNEANIKGDTIDDGDYVIVDPDDTSTKDGDYVLSIIDGMANIKRFYRDENSQVVVLKSESKTDLPPIVIDPNDVQYMINGKVVRVIKQVS